MRSVHRPVVITATALFAMALLTSKAAALTWTCSTVAQRNATDPLGGVFGSTFEEPAINGSGDVAFHAKVKGAGRRLLLYPGAGAPLVIATQGDAAPGGGEFRKFAMPSVNDAGDVGFRSDLAGSDDAAYVRTAGGTLVEAAVTGDASPAGGTFGRIDAVSRVNAAGDLAFLARGNGGPDGVFVFDLGSTTVDTIAAVGDATGDGRTFCSFVSGRILDLGDSGEAAFQARTAIDCNAGPEIAGVWLTGAGSYVNVADVGSGAPITGTSYTQMQGTPLANASDQVLFRAKVGPADTCNNVTANLCALDADCANTCLGGTNVGESCTTVTDCPDDDAGTSCDAGVCGGNRCLGGAAIGKPCGADSDCGGNECGVPGQRGKALFRFDPAGPSTTTVVAEGDTAPDTGGGTLKTLAPPAGFSNAGGTAFRAKVRGGSTDHGTFAFNGTDETIALRSDAVPTDAFGLGTTYRKILEDTGLDRSGTWFTLAARVRDTTQPPSNAGLLRCHGL
jgi:hypothetical protein